jgi:hypothetical protein
MKGYHVKKPKKNRTAFHTLPKPLKMSLKCSTMRMWGA